MEAEAVDGNHRCRGTEKHSRKEGEGGVQGVRDL